MNKESGSFLQKKQRPGRGETVWVLMQDPTREDDIVLVPIQGETISVYPANSLGETSIYVRLFDNNRRHWVGNISLVYDHLPLYEQVTDSLGTTFIWR